jgi:multidrug transporter EmrE-like cation transporter
MGIALSYEVNYRPQGQADNLRLCMRLAETVATNKGAGMKTAIIYIIISVLASTVGQLLLKKGMNSMGSVTLSLNQLPSVLWQMVTNLNVFIGLAIYFGGTIFWLAALSRVDLSYAYPFASLSYMVMLVASWIMFDEKITLSRVLGTIVIGAGVLLIYRN